MEKIITVEVKVNPINDKCNACEYYRLYHPELMGYCHLFQKTNDAKQLYECKAKCEQWAREDEQEEERSPQ